MVKHPPRLILSSHFNNFDISAFNFVLNAFNAPSIASFTFLSHCWHNFVGMPFVLRPDLVVRAAGLPQNSHLFVIFPFPFPRRKISQYYSNNILNGAKNKLFCKNPVFSGFSVLKAVVWGGALFLITIVFFVSFRAAEWLFVDN